MTYTMTIMAEIVMPIREYLLGDFNAQVNESEENPFEAFLRLETALGAKALFYDTYAQATITSGGHARNPNLQWLEIVQKNVAFAQEMAQNLYASGELDPTKTIEASTLGLIKHWKESDYITFWLSTLARPELSGPGAVQRVADMVDQLNGELHKRDIDLSTFNDYTLAAENRAPNYFKLADSYIDTLATIEHTPVKKLVAVSETQNSLGASTERYFAKKLGARVYGLAIAQFGAQTLPAEYPSPLLFADTRSIVEYGGQIFDPEARTQVVLVPQQ